LWPRKKTIISMAARHSGRRRPRDRVGAGATICSNSRHRPHPIQGTVDGRGGTNTLEFRSAATKGTLPASGGGPIVRQFYQKRHDRTAVAFLGAGGQQHEFGSFYYTTLTNSGTLEPSAH